MKDMHQLQGLGNEPQPFTCDSCGQEQYPEHAETEEWSFPRSIQSSSPVLCPDCNHSIEDTEQ